MPDYDNTNSGALFKNNNKTRDNQPSHKGTIQTTCTHCGKDTEFWLSAWLKTARESGNRFFSLAVTEKEAPKPSAQKAKSPMDDFDDDIPF